MRGVKMPSEVDPLGEGDFLFGSTRILSPLSIRRSFHSVPLGPVNEAEEWWQSLEFASMTVIRTAGPKEF